MSVLLQTSFGDIVIDLFIEKTPNACLNFIKLCKLKHYNNSLFVEIQKNYVTKVRPANPTTIWEKTGLKQPYFKDEIDVQAKFQQMGIVATANSGSNLNNSDFFITLTKSNLASLAGKHTIFGKVEEGLDVLRRINDTYVDNANRPQMNIRIMHTFIIHDPFPDLERMKMPDRSPSPVKDTERLEAVEHLQMLQKCKNESEIIEATRQQKAKKQAMTLEILGDLPDASLKPPENILFICKLNPITQQRDLQVIFSRFGPIKSVEIVRDWKNGQSLQYGFIEFQNINSCEQAYLKMNNVIIDDRRIQVDFSQSVSKLLHNSRGGIMHSKPKSKEQPEKRRELLPKIYTEGKDTREKYDIVISNQIQPKVPAELEDRPRSSYVDKREKLSGKIDERQRESPKLRKEKDRRRKRSRSRSQQRRRHRSKRSNSSSQSVERSRVKKHRKQKQSSSSSD